MRISSGGGVQAGSGSGSAEAQRSNAQSQTSAAAPRPSPAGTPAASGDVPVPNVRNLLLQDRGAFTSRPPLSLFGSPALGAESMSFKSGAPTTAPVAETQAPASTATSTVASTGATTPEEAQRKLTEAKGHYEEAQKKTEELTEKLNQDLARLGPALTDEQKQQYIAEFRERYPNEYAAESAAAKQLNAALNDPKLFEAARASGDVAQQSVDAAKLLAKSSEAPGVIGWATQALDPGGPAGTAFEGLKDSIDNDVLPPAAETVSGKVLAEKGGDIEAALNELEVLFKPLSRLSNGGARLASGITTIRSAIASGSPTPLRELSNSNTPASIAMAGIGAAYGLVAAVGKAREGEWGDFVRLMANAGRSGAQATAGVMRVLGESGRIAVETGGKAAEFLARLAPVFGVVANSVLLADHFKDFVNDPSVAGGLQALGDLIAVAGSGVAVALPGIGHIIEGVGMVLSGLAGAVIGNQEREARNNEVTSILEEMGVDPAAARALAGGEYLAARLEEELGLSAEQIQDAARRFPAMFEGQFLGQSVIDAAQACGMQGEEALGFIDELSKARPDFAWDLREVQTLVDRGLSEADMAQQWRSYIGTTYPGAQAFAQQHAPEIYGEGSESRLRAELDFASASSAADIPYSYAVYCYQNKGDDVYASEFVQRLEGEGTLDNYVAVNATGNDLYREGAKASLEAALRTGVLTEEELQTYLNGANGDAWRSLLGR